MNNTIIQLYDYVFLSNSIGRGIAYIIKSIFNPLPTAVEIETQTQCNRKCIYCPNSNQHREQGKMSDSMFYTVIGDLTAMKYKGVLSFHGNNEPLLDTRIVRFIEYARSKLPSVYILLYTNGDFLTQELFDKLVPNVDMIRVSLHDKTSKCNIVHPKITSFSYETILPNLGNWGGNIDIPENRRIPKMNKCFHAGQMSITWNGDLKICPWDYDGSTLFGNVNDSSLKNIWNSTKYKATRNKLQCGIFELDICRKCNN